MKTLHKIMALLGASALLAAAGQAGAAGTLAGTSINNTASVSYSIGGVAQPGANSNTASFIVDRKVNLTVAQVGGSATLTSAGATSQVTAFTVTNSSNATLDFRLFALNDIVGVTTAFGHTDSFTAANLRVYVDTAGTGVYNPAVDTATYIDELAPDTTKTVFIVADMPSNAPAGGVSGVNLTAVAAAGGTPGTLGADMTASLVFDPTQVETVFADAAGWSDLARDGRFSADSEFDVYGQFAQTTKTAQIISDPVNGTVNPMAIPGAVIQYCIVVKNIGTLTINNVGITDSIPANTTFVSTSIYSGGTALAGVCNSDGTAVSDASGFNGTTISTSVSSLIAGASTATRFRVTLN